MFVDIGDGSIFRPSSEAYSMIIRATPGGTLPHDRTTILDQIDRALAAGTYKSDFYRRL